MAKPWLIPAFTSFTMALAFFLAPQFPLLAGALKPWARYNLSLLLLLNALHINYRSLGQILLGRPLLLAYGILSKNILLPLAAFALCWWLWRPLLPAALLLAGISSGFSAVSFAILLRLRPEMNLLLTLGSSFVVPFSLPLLLQILASSQIRLDAVGMMLQTAGMIFVPVLLERSLYLGWHRLHSWLKQHSQPIVALNLSATAFILMLSGQKVLRSQARELGYIVGFAVFMVALIYIFSLVFFCRASLETQLVMLTSNLVSNSGLISVLALDYLDSRSLAIAIVFGVLWNFNILLLRFWASCRRYMARLLRYCCCG